MSEIKSNGRLQRLALQLLATACLVTIAHTASSQALPGPDAIPYVTQEARDRWERYVLAKVHKAYAVSETGAWSWRQGFDREEEAIAAALSACERYGSPCFLYAVNQTVVWDREKFQEKLKLEPPIADARPSASGEAPKSRVSLLEGTKLMVGRSTFAVPEGAWIVGSSQARPDGDDQIVEAYGHLFGSDGQFKAAFFHSAGTKIVWTDGTCDRSDAIIADRMQGDAGFPECLMLDFITTPEAASGYDGKVLRWLRANGVDVQDPVISATYVKYGGGDFVRIVYWMNPAALGLPTREGDRFKSNWNPRNLDARFVERVKAWSYEMARSGRASLEDRIPKLEALPPFPVPGP